MKIAPNPIQNNNTTLDKSPQMAPCKSNKNKMMMLRDNNGKITFICDEAYLGIGPWEVHP